MTTHQQQSFGEPPAPGEYWYYYTGLTLAGAAINEQILPGYAVCFDDVNPAPKLANPASPGTTKTGTGVCVTKPENNNLDKFAGLVEQFKPDDPSKPNGAGWMRVTTDAHRVKASVKANCNVTTSFLGPVNGKWHLVLVTGVGSLSAIATAVARPLATQDLSGVADNPARNMDVRLLRGLRCS